ncbi:MAG TPA: hypothetical protein DCL38_02450 [Lachnospiraceae bacterium]|nr:hypothetical protein [Lachnospiraceae bacterium]
MSTNKNIEKICLIIMAVVIVITIVFMNGKKLGMTAVVDEDSEANSDEYVFTENDMDGNWDISMATVISLNGTDISISGKGAYAYDGSVFISSAGWYAVSGELTDGQIVVDADSSSKVWIMLDGINVYKEDDAALRINQADKVFLTLAEGSENHLESGAQYSDEAIDQGSGGTIFSRDDLTINGSGALSIKAAYKHGIDANDDLVISGGIISVDSASDGLHVNDAFKFRDAGLTIKAGDDGIHSDIDIIVSEGSINISDCYEGLEAKNIDISGGSIEIHPQDDGINANGGSNTFMGGGMKGMPGMQGTGDNKASAAAADTKSEESAEEEKSYIRISGGSVLIVNENGRDSDGLDSNGDVLISGGTVRVSLSGGGSNNAVDYGSESGGSFLINGGDIIALGGSMMAESPDEASTQCSIFYNLSETKEAGTAVVLKNEAGEVILDYEPPCSFSNLTLSCPGLKLNETVSLSIGGEEEEIVLEGTVTSLGETAGFGGGMGGGRGFGRPGDIQGNDADASGDKQQ